MGPCITSPTNLHKKCHVYGVQHQVLLIWQSDGYNAWKHEYTQIQEWWFILYGDLFLILCCKMTHEVDLSHSQNSIWHYKIYSLRKYSFVLLSLSFFTCPFSITTNNEPISYWKFEINREKWYLSFVVSSSWVAQHRPHSACLH